MDTLLMAVLSLCLVIRKLDVIKERKLMIIKKNRQNLYPGLLKQNKCKHGLRKRIKKPCIISMVIDDIKHIAPILLCQLKSLKWATIYLTINYNDKYDS